MSVPAPAVGVDPERTRLEESGVAPSPLLGRATEQLGRGSVLAGKYRLELLLGEGGMGFVWSAYNVELQLPVAIKLLRTELKNSKLAQRLRREARAAARLVHPSIVRVFDIAVADNGDPFIVMELLTGESLAEVLARGRLSGVRAVQLMLPIAEALALSHSKGIVHRDLKPHNVFLSTDGEHLQPKLLDFGIAKLVHASELANKLTGKGMLLGSPNYMSPEQARGDDIDHRSDIWSFCVVLYKAITGAAPFADADKRIMMEALINDEPAPLAFDASVDEQLARLIRWGLTKNPAQRPTSIRELGRQLAQWLLSQGVSDDACNAPLAAKWIAHVAEPSMRRPPALAVTRRAEAPPEPIIERILPARHRPWALLAAVSILVVGGSIAWATSSAPKPGAQSASAEPVSSPDLPVAATPVVLLASELAVPQASAAPPVELQSSTPPERAVAKPRSSPSGKHAAAVAQLPFP